MFDYTLTLMEIFSKIKFTIKALLSYFGTKMIFAKRLSYWEHIDVAFSYKYLKSYCS